MSTRTQPLPRGRVRLTTRAGLLAIVAALLLMVSITPIREYLSQRDRIAELQRQTALLERATADLKSQVGRLRDPDELERIARECLGMVKPGETAFIPVPKRGEVVPPPC